MRAGVSGSGKCDDGVCNSCRRVDWAGVVVEELLQGPADVGGVSTREARGVYDRAKVKGVVGTGEGAGRWLALWSFRIIESCMPR